MQRSDPTLDSLTSELQLPGSSPFPWLIVAALVAGLGVSAAVGWVKFSLPSTPKERREKAIAELVAGQKEFQAFANLARVKSGWTAAAAMLKALQQKQESGLASAVELETLFTSLSESDQGRRIAADPDMVAQFVALRDRKRLSIKELKAIREALKENQRVNDRALADETLLIDVDPNLVAQIKATEADQSQFTELDRDLASLRLLVEQAGRNPPAEATLAQAVAAWKRSEAATALAKLAPPAAPVSLRMEPADEAMLTLLNDAKTEKEQAIVRQAQRILASVQATYTLDIEFRAALPEIHTLLLPMIGHGSMQLAGEDKHFWYRGNPGPLSLAKLKQFGALEPGNEKWLGEVFCEEPNNMHRDGLFTSHINDRNLGSFPRLLADDNGEFKRAQELLIKFGNLMVEQGLLNP